MERCYIYWCYDGKKPPPPDFFERVLYANRDAEQHMFWYEKVIEYIKFAKA